jgi:hypothetical protein
LKGNFCLGLIIFVERRGGAGGGLEGIYYDCWFWLAGLAFFRSWCSSSTHGSFLAMGCGVVFVLATLYHFLRPDPMSHWLCYVCTFQCSIPDVCSKNNGVFDEHERGHSELNMHVHLAKQCAIPAVVWL